MGDLGGARFADSSQLDQNIDQTRRILELAANLNVPLVTAQIGAFDADAPARQRDLIVEAVRQIADYADHSGTIFAVESAGGRPEALHALLKGIDCAFVKASVDPAELVLEGMNPVEAVETLADDVVMARARDALLGSKDRRGRETSLGQGNVDIIGYLQALEEAGYGGPTMVRRVDTDRPAHELAAAKAFLDSLRKS
jgi:sugar phosphate isomerase/epimerase